MECLAKLKASSLALLLEWCSTVILKNIFRKKVPQHPPAPWVERWKSRYQENEQSLQLFSIQFWIFLNYHRLKKNKIKGKDKREKLKCKYLRYKKKAENITYIFKMKKTWDCNTLFWKQLTQHGKTNLTPH